MQVHYSFSNISQHFLKGPRNSDVTLMPWLNPDLRFVLNIMSARTSQSYYSWWYSNDAIGQRVGWFLSYLMMLHQLWR